MRVLITGASGFAGSYLAEYLCSLPEPLAVWGCAQTATAHPAAPAQLQWITADLRDPAQVQAVIQQVLPDQIYHLAALASVGESWARPWETLATNLQAQLNLLEAVVAADLKPRMLVVSSAEVYGRVAPAALPIGENHPLRPENPYSVSKASQDLLALQYTLSRGLPIVRVRPFNHIGPRQDHRFVVAAFAAQVAAVEAGQQPPVLRVGNLSSRRDFTDVRDMVRAYHLALTQGEAGEVYNLGRGASHSIQAVLAGLCAAAQVPITVEVDPARVRPVDVPDLVCDVSKFRARTGWQPQIAFEQSLRDVLAYERSLLLAK